MTARKKISNTKIVQFLESLPSYFILFVVATLAVPSGCGVVHRFFRRFSYAAIEAATEKDSTSSLAPHNYDHKAQNRVDFSIVIFMIMLLPIILLLVLLLPLMTSHPGLMRWGIMVFFLFGLIGALTTWIRLLPRLYLFPKSPSKLRNTNPS